MVLAAQSPCWGQGQCRKPGPATRGSPRAALGGSGVGSKVGVAWGHQRPWKAWRKLKQQLQGLASWCRGIMERAGEQL